MGSVPGIARDIALGLGWAVLFAFFLAMAWAGLMISVMDPLPDPEPPEAPAPPPAATGRETSLSR